MKHRYVLKTLLICLGSFVLVYIGFAINSSLKADKQNESSITFQIQKAAFIKPEKTPGVHHYARVEISVNDDLTSPDGKVLDVSFNDDQITLRPTDSRGRRGSTFLQLKPGVYTIKWKVKNNKYSWPRYTNYKKNINVTSSDLWIHILINGKNITIS